MDDDRRRVGRFAITIVRLYASYMLNQPDPTPHHAASAIPAPIREIFAEADDLIEALERRPEVPGNHAERRREERDERELEARERRRERARQADELTALAREQEQHRRELARGQAEEREKPGSTRREYHRLQVKELAARADHERETLRERHRLERAERGQRHVGILGPTRSGKTSGILIPQAMTWPGLLISTSTRADVLKAARRRRLEAAEYYGGDVYVYSPMTTDELVEGVRTIGWSPADGCEDPPTCEVRVDKMLGPEPKKMSENEAFFRGHAGTIVRGFFHTVALEECGVRTLKSWIDHMRVDEAVAILERNRDRSYAAELYASALEGRPNCTTSSAAFRRCSRPPKVARRSGWWGRRRHTRRRRSRRPSERRRR